jgi:HSP20 family protein
MKQAHLAPWRWGGLGRWEEERPFETLRRDMEAFQRNMDRLFEGMMGDRPIMLPGYRAAGEMTPRLDESEDDQAYHVDIELPGMDENDVEVTLSDGLLTISGEKKAAEVEKEEKLFRRERAYGSFRRMLPLPGAVDEAKIKAAFRNGVLTIDLPKTKEAQAKVRHIEVKSG